MQIDRVLNQDVVTYILHGKMLGGPDSHRILDYLHEEIEKNQKKFIIDIENVKWVNSSGLGILINVLNVAKQHDTHLVIAHASEQVQKMMKITRLDRIFTLADTQGQAMDLLTNDSVNQ